MALGRVNRVASNAERGKPVCRQGSIRPHTNSQSGISAHAGIQGAWAAFGHGGGMTPSHGWIASNRSHRASNRIGLNRHPRQAGREAEAKQSVSPSGNNPSGRQFPPPPMALRPPSDFGMAEGGSMKREGPRRAACFPRPPTLLAPVHPCQAQWQWRGSVPQRTTPQDRK